MAQAVALLSGGLDSGTAVGLWLEQGQRIALCITVDYGQRSRLAEARTARALALRYRIPWREVDCPWLGEAAQRAGSALVPGTRDLPRASAHSGGDASSAAAVWVPARNVVLIAVAAAFAEALHADAVLAGFNREEAQTFPDNSAAFVAAMTAALALGTRAGLQVVSPTLDLDKRQIVAHARRLGLDATAFWSCYEAGPKPCRECESCARSARAWSTDG